MRSSSLSASLAAAVAGFLLAGSAALPAQAQSTAGTPAIGQAVSGHNTTAAGTSGTGLRTDGTAVTRSPHGEVGRQAAGVNGAGQVTGKSTAVINPAPGQADNVNAQATNTTAPAGAAPDAKATGGRGEAGTKAEQEVIRANTRQVHAVPGARNKTQASARDLRRKRAVSKQKGRQKAAHPGTTGQGQTGRSGAMGRSGTTGMTTSSGS